MRTTLLAAGLVSGCPAKDNPLYGLTDGPADSAGVTSQGATGSDSTSSTASSNGSGSATTAGGSTSSDSSSTGPAPAPEVCDGIDNDLDGLIDEVAADNGDCEGCELQQRGGQALWLCFDDSMQWSDAELFCTNLGAHLISVHDEDTNAFINELASATGASFWIGLFDQADLFNWAWTDGSPYDFTTGWASMQPDNGLGGEDCVHVLGSGDGWNDWSCANQLPFVCAVDHEM